MKILGLDLSTRQGSIALAESGDIIIERTWPNDRRSSAPFFAAVEEIISAHDSVDLIAVGLGPGSYTGTRIAIAAAIGLATVNGAQLAGSPSITSLSAERAYHVIGDAKRSSFFWADVCDYSLETAPVLLSAAELARRIAATSCPIYTSDELPQFAAAMLRFPSAALLVSHAHRAPEKLSRAPLAPIYLREPHITTPRRQR